MTKKNHPDGTASDPTVPSIGSAENDVEGTAVEAEGTFSPIAQHCNGIVSALNQLEHVPDAVQHTIAVYIADILATFTETERKARTARENVSQLKSNLRRANEEIAKLRKAKFGQSSERCTDGDLDNCDDLCSGDGILDDVDFEDDEETKEKIKGRRARKVPPTIETKEIDHFPHNRTCFTCGCEMHVIGVESTSRLKIIPEHVVRIKENYHRLACNHGVCKDNKPVAAKSQHYIMKRRTLDPRVVIEAACQKFFEHSTTFRMERRLHFQDLNVSRQTLGRNIEYLADCLEPLHKATLDTVQQGNVAFMDETPLRIQSTTSGKGKCETGYLWAFSRDESGWNPEARPVVHFHYAPTRSGSVAKELLANSSVEILQTDGYAGYQKLFDAAGANYSLKRAGCLTHARRKFVEAETASSSPLARRVISKLKKLYKIEEDIRGFPPSSREAVRQEKSLPLMLQIRDDLVQNAVVADGQIKTAIKYILKSWDDFQRFIFDGRIEIDSNSIERCMRGIALSKKNSLFAGSHKAARVWAIYYSLFETARMNKVNPRSYLNWVVCEIEAKRGDLDYGQLLPWHCPDGRIKG